MNPLLHIAISNTILAAALAALALVVSWLWKNRHVTHLLWVLVLAKLITPPLWYVPVPVAALVSAIPTDAPQSEPLGRMDESAIDDVSQLLPGRMEIPVRHPAADQIQSSIEATAVGTYHGDPAAPTPEIPASALDASLLLDWSTVLIRLWLVTSTLCAVLVILRIARFHRLARCGQSADAHLAERVARLAQRLGLSRVPDVRMFDAGISPMVWPLAWRRMLLLPRRLAGKLTPAQLDTVIAHELAHLVRRDELVRFLETVVTCLFWWSPVVWLARRELQAAEEECCDALVVCSLPESRQQYGEALLNAAELITFRQSLPTLASAFGQRHLKRRIEMILNHKFHRSASWQAKLALLFVALTVLPLAATAMSQESTAPAVAQPARDGFDELTVARVDGEAITRQQLADVCLRRHGEQQLDGLILRTLIERACRREGITIAKGELDAEIEHLANKFEISVEEWLRKLQDDRNISPDEYRQDVLWPTIALRKLSGSRHSQVASQFLKNLQANAMIEKHFRSADATSGQHVPGNETVVARVNGEAITRQQLADVCLRRHGEQQLDGLILRTLIERACRQEEITIAQGELDAEVERLANKFEISVEEWLRKLQDDRNISPDDYRQDVLWPTIALRKLSGSRESQVASQFLKNLQGKATIEKHGSSD